MEVTTNPEKNSPILSIMDTIEFMKRFDLAVKKLDLKILHKAFKDFRLDYHPETNDFLTTSKIIFAKYNNPKKNIHLIDVQKRDSKCIACSFGKKVIAYDVKFKKIESNYSVVYSSSFAINLDINLGELIDFVWCNTFLNKSEMNELRELK